jgi:Xaa-Pro aminopeptidase
MSKPESTLLPNALADACAHRRSGLLPVLQTAGIDALLLSCEKDIQYLTGFVGHEGLGMVAIEGGSLRGIIISDSRYDEYLEPWRKADAAEIVMGTRHRLPEAVRQVCAQRGIKRLGVQAEHITVAGREKLAKAVGDPLLTNTIDLVGAQRIRKDAFEIERIEQAESLAQDAMTAAVNQLSLGMTELQFSAVLEYEMKSRGAHGSAFTPIIGAGANSSIIHHSTGNTPIAPGVLLVDWGAMVDGYNSDLTRTFFIGPATAKLREAYKIVLDAQMAAIDAIAPGKACAEIDAVARDIIAKAGYGPQFGHGLGHGLGMDVHEEPYFNSLQTDVALQPGMVMTVEPGIYLPGVGGVRIEDDVLVTDRGCRVLSDWPKDLSSAAIEPAALMGTRA